MNKGEPYYADVVLRTGRVLRIPVLVPFINTIPDELVIRIFRFAHASTEDPCQLGWRLLAVSRRFRALASAYGAFWQEIRIEWIEHNAGRRFRANADAAGGKPLSVFYHGHLTPEEEPDYEYYWDIIFPAIVSRLHLIRTLVLDLEIQDDEFVAITKTFGHCTAPLLETLHIRSGFQYRPHATALFTGGAPTLREIKYTGLDYATARVPLLEMTSIEINSPASFQDVHQMLLDARKLTSLCLRRGSFKAPGIDEFSSWTPGHAVYAQYQLTLPELVSLDVDRNTCILLDIIRAPKLKRLSMGNTEPTKFLTFLHLAPASSFLNLRALLMCTGSEYEGTTLSPAELLALANRLPDVEDLEIIHARGTSDESILNMLASDVEAWPRLSQLTLVGADRTPLMACIRARAPLGLKTLRFCRHFLARVCRAHVGAEKAISDLGVTVRESAEEHWNISAGTEYIW
jgi:hypothetical protein